MTFESHRTECSGPGRADSESRPQGLWPPGPAARPWPGASPAGASVQVRVASHSVTVGPSHESPGPRAADCPGRRALTRRIGPDIGLSPRLRLALLARPALTRRLPSLSRPAAAAAGRPGPGRTVVPVPVAGPGARAKPGARARPDAAAALRAAGCQARAAIINDSQSRSP